MTDREHDLTAFAEDLRNIDRHAAAVRGYVRWLPEVAGTEEGAQRTQPDFPKILDKTMAWIKSPMQDCIKLAASDIHVPRTMTPFSCTTGFQRGHLRYPNPPYLTQILFGALIQQSNIHRTSGSLRYRSCRSAILPLAGLPKNDEVYALPALLHLQYLPKACRSAWSSRFSSARFSIRTAKTASAAQGRPRHYRARLTAVWRHPMISCLRGSAPLKHVSKCKQRRTSFEMWYLSWLSHAAEQVQRLENEAREATEEAQQAAQQSLSSRSTSSGTQQHVRNPAKINWPASEAFDGSIFSRPEESNVVCTIPSTSIRPLDAKQYRSNCSTIELLVRIRDLCVPDEFWKVGETCTETLVYALDAPSQLQPSTSNQSLPSEAIARHLVDLSFKESFHMWPFVDPDVVRSNLDALYQRDGFHPSKAKPDEVALTWALIALGQCYESRSPSATAATSSQQHTSSMAYLANASVIINDQAYDRTLASVQTSMCIAQWLKVGNCTSASHGYLSIAASVALRLGLHDVDAMAQLPSNERKWSARTIAALTAMDTLTSISLGLPRILGASVDSALFHEDPGDALPTHQAHYEVTEILRRYFEPCFLSQSFKNGTIYQLPQRRIDSVTEELEAWKTRLGELFSNYDGTLTPRLAIELSYFLIHLLVYCPFAHYIGTTPDPVLAGYATKCVEAALQTVLIAEELQRRRILVSVHPFALDAVILATTSLLLSEVRTRYQAQTTIIDTSTSGRAVDLLYSLSIQSDSAKSGVSWIEQMKRDTMKMALDTTNQTALPPVSELLRYNGNNDAGPLRTSFGNTSLSPFSAAWRNIDSDMPDALGRYTPSTERPKIDVDHQSRANIHADTESR